MHKENNKRGAIAPFTVEVMPIGRLGLLAALCSTHLWFLTASNMLVPSQCLEILL